jgi:amino acid transporter
MVAASVFATLTTFNAGLMGGSRLLYILAREKKFFVWASHLSDRTGNPTRAVVVIAIGCWTMAMLEWYFDAYLEASTVCAALYAGVYACFGFANVRLRKSRPTARRSFRAPLPAAAQAVIASVMGVFGIALLASLQGRPSLVFGGLAASIAAAIGMALWFSKRTVAIRPTVTIVAEAE